ncbi:MAG TPA: hypothetical protein VFM42_03990 [Sphingomicrobium sp.]|nr:hypothetical protein [Sphingomicrobium sp.]
MRIPYISILAAGAVALGGCAYGGFGYGGGYGGYGGYGGSYIGVGYSSGYYPYGGYGYGYPYYGWYDNFYYPGTGFYVYDVYRRPHRMTSSQRVYWSRRSPALRTSSTTRVRPNWSGFNHRTTRTTHRRGRDD